MLISRRRHFIFIHIHKNAGTSITDALKPFAANKWEKLAYLISRKLNVAQKFDSQIYAPHISASKLVDMIGKEVFDSLFSFAIVRNPWDRQVSLYKFILNEVSHFQHELVKNLGSFEEFIKWQCAEKVPFQKDFIYSSDGELLVDFVGRFEKLEEDFAKICSHIGVSTSLPKLNVSNAESYRHFYNEECRDLVRRKFDPDITLFGYDF